MLPNSGLICLPLLLSSDVNSELVCKPLDRPASVTRVKSLKEERCIRRQHQVQRDVVATPQ